MATRTTTVPPVGIDLGTTYSCLSYLSPQGQPETIPNSEGELSTPSVVLFEGEEIIVGTEALRSAVSQPERAVVHVKRHMGDSQKCWVIDGHVYRPPDISAFILRKLLAAAEERIGKVRHAVITVPAQFGDIQRQQTVEAGLKAGLERVDIINEPVAAALCYVLSEGMWFSELAHDQTIMVFDLGGGTFDLSLVRYNKSEVRVIASGGDLHLGGLDWNRLLEEHLCNEFARVSHSDPRLDRESMQALAIEVEQVKRTLSVRNKASVIVNHLGQRKVFAIDRDSFEMLTRGLVQRTQEITKGLLKSNKMGWAHVDAVLVTGGASRMPMVRDMLQRISGTTLNSTLSPDQSICHGAAYYAGMLLSGQKLERTTLNKEATARLASFKQQSVTARGLGILVRDPNSGKRFPHYLIPPNTPLPHSVQQQFGTVNANQKRVHLHIVESGAAEKDPHVELGACIVEGIAENLPPGSPIDVTIRYDEQARVHVEAIDVSSGARAEALIVRKENLRPAAPEKAADEEAQLVPPPMAKVPQPPAKATVPPPPPPPAIKTVPVKPLSAVKPGGSSVFVPVTAQPTLPPALPAARKTAPSAGSRPPKIDTVVSLDEAERPVPLCNRCGEPLDTRGNCRRCKGQATQKAKPPAPPKTVKRPPQGDETDNMPPSSLPSKRPKPKLRD